MVYGDTDSLFVSLPGRSKEEAFKIGNDIADTVTAMNPKPVKLKFEKVSSLVHHRFATQTDYSTGVHGFCPHGQETIRWFQV